MREELGPRTHVVWAFSKDFAMSGLRCGVLVSENAGLLGAVDALADWSSGSRDTRQLLTAMIEDEGWVETFVAENQRRLRAAYHRNVSPTDAVVEGIARVAHALTVAPKHSDAAADRGCGARRRSGRSHPLEAGCSKCSTPLDSL